MEENRYAPTKAALAESPYGDAGMGTLRLASRWRRFSNLIIDAIVCELIYGAVGTVVGGVANFAESDLISSLLVDYILGMIVSLAYYILMEGYLGATVGKLVTGTRVVSESGERPPLAQIWKRTWLRAVPFEAFSFLWPRPGWHDRWSRTRVISIRR